MNQVELFLKELRESSDMIYTIYSEGSCFKLFKIISIVFPTATPYWSNRDNHCIIRIGDSFYDIGGKLSIDYIDRSKYIEIDPINYPYYDLYKHTNKDNNRSVNVNKYITN